MRQQPTTDFKAINFIEVFISLNGGKLQYLIKKCLSSRGFRVVKYQAHEGAGVNQIIRDFGFDIRVPVCLL